jgi:hypothetical protein
MPTGDLDPVVDMHTIALYEGIHLCCNARQYLHVYLCAYLRTVFFLWSHFVEAGEGRRQERARPMSQGVPSFGRYQRRLGITVERQTWTLL